MTFETSLPSPRFIRLAALTSCVLAAVSLLASLWVYSRWSYPAKFTHANSSGSWTESAASFLLAYPAFQAVLSFALAWHAVRWRTLFRAIREREIVLKARDERFRQLDAFALVQAVSCLVVAVNVALLMSTIYRIWTLAPGAYRP